MYMLGSQNSPHSSVVTIATAIILVEIVDKLSVFDDTALTPWGV